MVLSGMSEMAHVEENIRVAKEAWPETLTAKELELFDQVKEIYRLKIKVECTDCCYCMSCPQEIEIVPIFQLYNNIYMYNSLKDLQKFYKHLLNQEKDAGKCVECGICEAACPQKLPIIQHLKEAHKIIAN